MVVALLAICISATAHAEQARDYSVPPGALGSVLVALGRQGALNIGLTDSTLAARLSKGVRGHYDAKSALRIVLRDTGGDFTFVDPQTVRVFTARHGTAPSIPRHPVSAMPEPKPVPPVEIIVTASKQAIPLVRYPATAIIVDLNAEPGSSESAQGTAAVIARLPTLAATALGSGRNKLFIRGVADSSFNGGSQATVGQYLGDARLTYNAPDPNLNLYDMDRVEIVEGPQGTLYGTGAISGIIRLVPNAPDMVLTSGSLAAGLSATRHGAIGIDGAAMVNLPIIGDRLALRGVAYATSEGGYIADTLRGLANVNRTQTEGGRLAVRWKAQSGWTIDAGLIVQNIASRDGQYAQRGRPDLTRATQIAQPFDNDYRMGFVALDRGIAGNRLTSTTAIVRHDVNTTYDATGFDGSNTIARFDEKIGITLISHETRLSGGAARLPWLVGISGVYDISRVSRALGNANAPPPISGVRNETGELAVFGQYGFPLADHVQLTLGGRATYTRLNGNLIDDPKGELSEVRRNSLRFSPSLAIAWQARDRLLVFARFSHGSRAGGLAVSPTGSASDAKRFEADTLIAGELGMRWGNQRNDPVWASATLSYARWTDIQADLIDSAGLPYTTNVGDGHIVGLEAQIGWVPLPGLKLDAAIFVNASALHAPAAVFATSEERALPNIAGVGGSMSVHYTVDVAPRAALTLDCAIRYVGQSQLGIGIPFEIPQGDYLTSKLGMRLALAKIGISLDIANIGDVRANRFAYGNPFGAAAGNQITPVRPRTIRFGIDAHF